MEGWKDKGDCPNGPSGQQDGGQSWKKPKFEVGSAPRVRLGQVRAFFDPAFFILR